MVVGGWGCVWGWGSESALRTGCVHLSYLVSSCPRTQSSDISTRHSITASVHTRYKYFHQPQSAWVQYRLKNEFAGIPLLCENKTMRCKLKLANSTYWNKERGGVYIHWPPFIYLERALCPLGITQTAAGEVLLGRHRLNSSNAFDSCWTPVIAVFSCTSQLCLIG